MLSLIYLFKELSPELLDFIHQLVLNGLQIFLEGIDLRVSVRALALRRLQVKRRKDTKRRS